MAWFLEICFDVWPAPGALYGTPLHPLSQHRVLLFYATLSLRKTHKKIILIQKSIWIETRSLYVFVVSFDPFRLVSHRLFFF